jgi:hypothetical protein
MRDKVPLPAAPMLDPAVRERIVDRDREAARARPSALDYEARMDAAGWNTRPSLVGRIRSWIAQGRESFAHRVSSQRAVDTPALVALAAPLSFGSAGSAGLPITEQSESVVTADPGGAGSSFGDRRQESGK